MFAPVFEQMYAVLLGVGAPFLLSIPVENEGAPFISGVGDLTQGLKGAKNRLYH